MALDIWKVLTLIPLLCCSLVALALILERSVFLRRSRALPKGQRQQLLEQLIEERWQSAWQQLQQLQPFYGQALKQLYDWRGRDKQLRDDAAATVMLEINEALQARLSGLVTLAGLAPMFGLLGTVVGLMKAFYEIGLRQGPIEPSLVADGLWQALTTTAVGLLIATACIIAHALFTVRVRQRQTEARLVLNKFSLSLVNASREC